MSAAAARALDVTEELSHAAESGDVEAVALLLPYAADINARNRYGTTPLMKAASCGHTQVVRLLLEHGADPNLTRNDNFTALVLAAFFGHTETVKTLMEFGARTEAVTRSGASAHTWATARTFADVARCLDTPNPKTTQPRTPVQLRRRSSSSRILTLGVIATFIVSVCCGLGALVLKSSEAHDLPRVELQPPPKVEPPKVENTVTTPEPEPVPPEPIVNKAPAESSPRSRVRPPIKKDREVKSVTVLSERPVEEPAEKLQITEPVVVAKPKPYSPRPAPLSPQIMAPTKKAKVIQWP